MAEKKLLHLNFGVAVRYLECHVQKAKRLSYKAMNNIIMKPEMILKQWSWNLMKHKLSFLDHIMWDITAIEKEACVAKHKGKWEKGGLVVDR